MGLSILSLAALAAVLYFGWALVDPGTLQEVENKVTRQGSAPVTSVVSWRLRNGIGLVIGLALLSYGLYCDVTAGETPVRVVKKTVVHTTAPELSEDPSISERIDELTLKKQIEHQRRSATLAQP